MLSSTQVSKSQVLSRCWQALYVVVFTSTIPLGIAAGVGLQNAPSDNREIVSAVLEAFATGKSKRQHYTLRMTTIFCGVKNESEFLMFTKAVQTFCSQSSDGANRCQCPISGNHFNIINIPKIVITNFHANLISYVC